MISEEYSAGMLVRETIDRETRRYTDNQTNRQTIRNTGILWSSQP